MKTDDVIEDKYGLSPMQQGMLFHALYDQRLGLYLDHAVFDFPDHALNVAAFERAWKRVVDRHMSIFRSMPKIRGISRRPIKRNNSSIISSPTGNGGSR
jgi:hypothetical protein